MIRAAFIVPLLSCFLSISCTRENLPDTELSLPAPEPDHPVFISNNQFGLDLYQVLQNSLQDKNLCASPYSIFVALSMLANGIDGEAYTELCNELRLSQDDLESSNNQYRLLMQYLSGVDSVVTFESANSFWYQEELEVNHQFKSDLDYYYNAEVNPVDFKDPGTTTLINDWVKRKTHNKIKEIVSSFPPITISNLTNAVYFNGEWTNKFNRKLTKYETFNKLDRTSSRVPTMVNTQPYRYYDHPSWYGLELPYGNGHWAMYLFMPKQISQLDRITQWLVSDWIRIRSGFKSGEAIKIHLPQFKIENSFNLIPYLQETGITQIFQPGVDFSKMMEGALKIDMIIHKTFIDVNEDGTEAAAVTSISVVGSPPPSGIYFDHPFVYMIAEKSTGLILFIGQVTDL